MPLIDYAQLTLPYASIGTSLYELLYGRLARTSFDQKAPKTKISATVQLNQRRGHDLAKQLEEKRDTIQRLAQSMTARLSFSRDMIAKAQDRIATQANKHRREVDFVVSNKVYITTRNWITDRLS